MKRILQFILLFPLLTVAQNPTVDSLLLVLKNAKHDTLRCALLNQLVDSEPDEEKLTAYNNQYMALAQKCSASSTIPADKKKYLKHLSIAYNNASYLAEEHGEVKQMLDYRQKSLKISEDLKDEEGIASSLNHLAIIHEHDGDIEKALEFFNKSIAIRKKIKDQKGLATSYCNIGGVYENQGDISKGLEYYHMALKIQEEIVDKEGIALTLNNIGFIYINQDDIPKALEFLQRALTIYTEIEDKSGIAFTLNNIGSCYKNQNNTEKALYYFNESLKTCQEIDYQEGIGAGLNAIGTIYLKKGDYKKTLEYYQKALNIFETIGNSYGINNGLKDIGVVLLKLGKLNEALSYAKRSLETAKEMGYPQNIKNSAELLKTIYQKQNNYDEALKMFELEILMRDSVTNEETKKAALKKQLAYEYEKKAAADSVKHAEEQKVNNALLKAQQAQLKQEKTQRFVLYGGLVLVIAFLVFIVNRFHITRKQKTIIEQQKVMVDNAFEQLHEKNREVIDSIHYAKRIQSALMTSEKYIDRKLNDLNS